MDLISKRLTSLKESATLAMASKARELKATGADVISLSLGEPDFKTPKHIQDGAKEAIDTEKYFAYPPVPGYLDLREAIAKKLKEENNIDCTFENIVVSNGAKQSIANVMYSLLDPGDEVVVFSPYWVSYSAIIQLAGGTPVYIKGDLENDYKATAEQLEKAITSKTKALIYSSPCNPTGAVFTDEELHAIADVIRRHEGIIAVADEIYEKINYTDSTLSLGSLEGMKDRVVTVNGFAKGFAMTGWRVGYACAALPIAKACIKMQGQITSANSSISQRAAYTAITSDLGATIEMTNQYQKRRDVVFELLNSIEGFKTFLPKGAFYFFPDVSHYFGKSNGEKTINDANDFAMLLLEKAHVSVVSGEAFGEPNAVRISYAASMEDLEEAISRIKKVLSDFS
ncbi:MAG: pyridoxal phosphate-dependent aminotransferase [Bacteroidota bacterium]